MLKSDTKITGYILISMWDPDQAEIFCVEAPDSSQCEELITFAAQFAFDKGRNEVLFMAEENSDSHKAALSAGFTVTGFYKAYKIEGTD